MSSARSLLLRPPAVSTPAAISIIAPASSAKQARIDSGLANLTALGFTPSVGENTLARGPHYFAGTPAQRITDLHAAFANPDTAAVMALRGGYGSNYLLNDLDLDLIRNHPKPFFCYSDLTGIQLHLYDQLCLPAFHGPMLAADFYLENGIHLPSFQAALAGQPYSVGPAEGLRILKPGLDSHPVSGTLYGGCLSILASLIGTAWEPETEGKLLFIEDTGAKPYQIDRMLWQLIHAGKLDGVRGIIFGEMLDCASPGAPPELLEEAIQRVFEDFDGPIGFGLRSGHVSHHNVTLTFGVQAELITTDTPELRILEPAVTL
ncbi:MAG: LD-carboxypeptidase [Terracidiphilus sp.]|jgi:muramoyltetrapeptide carboxypeptidase